jgi:alpha-beta hydrolase superfamily lysophospholipase
MPAERKTPAGTPPEAGGKKRPPGCFHLHERGAGWSRTRYVQLPEGTHTIMMEKNRLMLFEAVQAFLDEAGRS